MDSTILQVYDVKTTLYNRGDDTMIMLQSPEVSFGVACQGTDGQPLEPRWNYRIMGNLQGILYEVDKIWIKKEGNKLKIQLWNDGDIPSATIVALPDAEVEVNWFIRTPTYFNESGVKLRGDVKNG